jgi:hypothetical protein
MASRTLLATYDPDWQIRRERCYAALEASRAEQQADETAVDVDLDVYRERFAPRGRWQRARAAFGSCAEGTYRPAALHFYDYLPWNVSGTHFCLEEFCSVSLTWSTQGFVRPEWTRLCSTPVFVAETARRLRRQVRSNRPRVLRGTTTLNEVVWI